MKIDNMIAIEWSIEQGCFHSHTIEKMLNHNLSACLGERGGIDFIPIGIFETEEDSYDFMGKYLSRLEREAQNGR